MLVCTSIQTHTHTHSHTCPFDALLALTSLRFVSRLAPLSQVRSRAFGWWPRYRRWCSRTKRPCQGRPRRARTVSTEAPKSREKKHPKAELVHPSCPRGARFFYETLRNQILASSSRTGFIRLRSIGMSVRLRLDGSNTRRSEPMPSSGEGPPLHSCTRTLFVSHCLFRFWGDQFYCFCNKQHHG